MNQPLKSLAISRAKAVSVEGEHRITFVASSSSIDRDREIVEIGTFYLPVKSGGHIRVQDLPQDGADNVDVPFIANHNLWDVTQTLGSVRNAKYVGGELVFEVGVSSREYAQDMFKLVEEGHLDNAFSIQWRGGGDSKDTDGITHYTDGEILEVSLVGRGANPDARVLGTKGLKEDGMETQPTNVEAQDKPVENSAESAETSEAVTTTTEDTTGAEEQPATETATEPETPAEETNETKGTTAMDTEVAKTLVKEPTQAKTITMESNYLKTNAAMHDFAKTIADNRGLRSEQIMAKWTDALKAKGITGDAILPSRLEQIFFKTWTDDNGILSTFRTANVNAASVNAFTGEGENIRAKGHKKGETKAEQSVENIRRDLKTLLVYKKLGIDLQDLLDDQTGEILRFRAEELAGRVYHEIAVAAVFGDGRTAPSSGNPDYRTFDGTRGLFSMAADITGSTTAGSFASLVATSVANAAADNGYDKIIKTAAEVKDEGRGKIAVVPTGFEATIRLAKDSNGAYLFQPGVDVGRLLGVNRFYEFDEMAGSGYDVIVYANGAYLLIGTGAMTRTDFDLRTNTDVMLFEKPAAGSLYGHRAAAGYKTASTSD